MNHFLSAEVLDKQVKRTNISATLARAEIRALLRREHIPTGGILHNVLVICLATQNYYKKYEMPLYLSVIYKLPQQFYEIEIELTFQCLNLLFDKYLVKMCQILEPIWNIQWYSRKLLGSRLHLDGHLHMHLLVVVGVMLYL